MNEISYNILNSIVGFLSGGVVIRLFKNDLVLTPSTRLADFVEADFAGYSPPTFNTEHNVFSQPFTGGAGFSQWYSQTPFPPYTPAQLVYGWYMTDTGLTGLYWARRFPVPIMMSPQNQEVPFQVKLFLAIPTQG